MAKKRGGRQQQQPQLHPQQIPIQIPTSQQIHYHQQQQQLQSSGQQVILNEPDKTKRWHTIYPQYINSNLTVQRGRRLPKSKCVSDPLAEEIFNVLAANQQQFEVQLNMYKCYNRELDKENIRTRGYIKYRIISDKNEFKNKKQILQYVASMIPKLKSRQNPKTGGSGNTGGGQSGGGGGGQDNSSSANTMGQSSSSNKTSGTGGGQQQAGSGNTGGGGGGNKKKNRRR